MSVGMQYTDMNYLVLFYSIGSVKRIDGWVIRVI